MKKRLHFLLLCCTLLALTIGGASAQGFPAKPLHIVVPFAAGGVADLSARTLAQKLAESLGQPVLVENRPGAGGVVAGELVAKAEPDGHTLLLISNGTAVSAGLFKSLPFDTLRDFAPVSTLGFFDLAIVVPAHSPYRSLAEFLAYARSQPGRLNLGTIGIGSTQHLAAELFKIRSGVDLQIVPYNGSPAVIAALRGAQLDAAIEIVAPVLPQIGAGALRALAVTGAARAAVLPTVPTAQESGVGDFVVSSWNGLAVPAKTPQAVIQRLNRDIVAALNGPEVKSRLQELNVQARSSTPEQAAALLQSEVKRWGEVIHRARVPQQ